MPTTKRLWKPNETLGKVSLIKSDVLDAYLFLLRSEETKGNKFREGVSTISGIIGSELAEELPKQRIEITTSVGEKTCGNVLDSKNALFVAILRSGYSLCSEIREQYMRDAKIALVDMKRDEKTAVASMNYDGLPKNLSNFDKIFVPDPMLATGGSATFVLDLLMERGAVQSNIYLASLVAAPEGIIKVHNKFPRLNILLCAVDGGLNEKKYIINPGLGDFGDKWLAGEKFTVFDEFNEKILSYPKGSLEPIVTDISIKSGLTERLTIC